MQFLMAPTSYYTTSITNMDLFNIARNILVQLPSSFFSSRFVSVQVVHPYSSIDTTVAWKKLHFILSVRFDFHMIDPTIRPPASHYENYPS